ncbi:hypothetical protein ACF1GW_38885 [Streptomyces achromogenes]|uniref:hypothetical protein n=1 Tax=Streptomyces achromogenes TaxID=67255 RepID=UPI0036F8671C
MSKPNRKVIRLQQMRAQRAQAAGVQYVDVVFEVPGDEEGTVKERICSFLTRDFWPVEIVESVEEANGDQNLHVLKQIATPAGAFDDLVKVAKLTVGELVELLDELQKEAGTEPGEDSGSSSSSESTPEPSVPTSSGTTPAAA